MAYITTEVSEIIDARPEKVYQILADYHTHHPAILPQPYFTKLEVEKGGTGAGTIAHVYMNVMGVKTTFRLEVSEPEKGRIIQEKDKEADLTTTFTLDPVQDGSKTRVTIHTDARASKGIKGLIERWVNPSITRKIYQKELAILNEYAKAMD